MQNTCILVIGRFFKAILCGNGDISYDSTFINLRNFILLFQNNSWFYRMLIHQFTVIKLSCWILKFDCFRRSHYVHALNVSILKRGIVRKSQTIYYMYLLRISLVYSPIYWILLNIVFFFRCTCISNLCGFSYAGENQITHNSQSSKKH